MGGGGDEKKLCIIGAGPAALSTVYHLRQRANLGEPTPKVVCYDKADVIGGNWNFNPSVGESVKLNKENFKENYRWMMCHYFIDVSFENQDIVSL